MEADSGQSPPSGKKKNKKKREENLVAKIIGKIIKQNEIEVHRYIHILCHLKQRPQTEKKGSCKTHHAWERQLGSMMFKWGMQKKEYDMTRRKRWLSESGGGWWRLRWWNEEEWEEEGETWEECVSKSEWWTVCSIPILSSCTYCRSGAAGALPVWQSPESFGLNPYWLIQPKLLSPSFFPSRSARQVGTGGLKRNQATVSCRSSQQSYLVWACHLSGQWMHEIREGEEEENVSATGGGGGSTGGALGGARGCRGVGGVGNLQKKWVEKLKERRLEKEKRFSPEWGGRESLKRKKRQNKFGQSKLERKERER